MSSRGRRPLVFKVRRRRLYGSGHAGKREREVLTIMKGVDPSVIGIGGDEDEVAILSLAKGAPDGAIDGGVNINRRLFISGAVTGSLEDTSE